MFSSILARGAGSNTSAYLHTNKFHINCNQTRGNTHRCMGNEHPKYFFKKRNKDEHTHPSSHYVYWDTPLFPLCLLVFLKDFFYFLFFLCTLFNTASSAASQITLQYVGGYWIAALVLTARNSDHSARSREQIVLPHNGSALHSWSRNHSINCVWMQRGTNRESMGIVTFRWVDTAEPSSPPPPPPPKEIKGLTINVPVL